MSDFRKSDPSYVGFVPETAAEAIDLFCRYRRLGVPPSQWPETFVHVSRALPEEEIDRFHEWLVCPQGPATGPTYEPCPEIEAERKQLVKEAESRDRMDVVEEDDEKVKESGRGEELRSHPLVTADLTASLADCSLERGADAGK